MLYGECFGAPHFYLTEFLFLIDIMTMHKALFHCCSFLKGMGMKCDKCGSDRVLAVSGKCSDMCSFVYKSNISRGNAPFGVGIGGGDYIRFDLCLECGKVQGEFPVGDPEE